MAGHAGSKFSVRVPEARWHGSCCFSGGRRDETPTGPIGRKGAAVNSIFYIIGVVVVVLFVLGYFGFR